MHFIDLFSTIKILLENRQILNYQIIYFVKKQYVLMY